jgi:hypothetical protein
MIKRSFFACQVAALDLPHRIPGHRRNEMDQLGHFEIRQASPTVHLKFLRAGGAS